MLRKVYCLRDCVLQKEKPIFGRGESYYSYDVCSPAIVIEHNISHKVIHETILMRPMAMKAEANSFSLQQSTDAMSHCFYRRISIKALLTR